MFDIGEVSAEFVTQAFVFLAILLVWNLIGRQLSDRETQGDEIPAWLVRLASVIHVGVIAGLALCILIFLFSGTVRNPTDFRYATF